MGSCHLQLRLEPLAARLNRPGAVRERGHQTESQYLGSTGPMIQANDLGQDLETEKKTSSYPRQLPKMGPQKQWGPIWEEGLPGQVLSLDPELVGKTQKQTLNQGLGR